MNSNSILFHENTGCDLEKGIYLPHYCHCLLNTRPKDPRKNTETPQGVIREQGEGEKIRREQGDWGIIRREQGD